MASFISSLWEKASNVGKAVAKQVAPVSGQSFGQRITQNLSPSALLDMARVSVAATAVPTGRPWTPSTTTAGVRAAPAPGAPSPTETTTYGGVSAYGGAGAGGAWDQMLSELGAAPEFGWSEEEARKTATERFGPYYDDLLNDYLTGLGLKREEVETKKVKYVGETGEEGRIAEDLATSLERARRGYAEAGLFWSGGQWGRKGKEKEIGIGAERQKVDVMDWYNQIQKQMALQEEQKKKEIGWAKKESIEADIWNQEARAREQYATQLREHYAPIETAWR